MYSITRKERRAFRSLLPYTIGVLLEGVFPAPPKSIWTYAAETIVMWLVSRLIGCLSIGIELVITLAHCGNSKKKKGLQNILSIQVFTVIEGAARWYLNFAPRQCPLSISTHTKWCVLFIEQRRPVEHDGVYRTLKGHCGCHSICSSASLLFTYLIVNFISWCGLISQFWKFALSVLARLPRCDTNSLQVLAMKKLTIIISYRH